MNSRVRYQAWLCGISYSRFCRTGEGSIRSGKWIYYHITAISRWESIIPCESEWDRRYRIWVCECEPRARSTYLHPGDRCSYRSSLWRVYRYWSSRTWGEGELEWEINLCRFSFLCESHYSSDCMLYQFSRFSYPCIRRVNSFYNSFRHSF